MINTLNKISKPDVSTKKNSKCISLPAFERPKTVSLSGYHLNHDISHF